MKFCRYDDDRLGVVRGSMVHDVTQAQTQIRAAAPYAMKGDAVIAALPAWRARLEQMADKAPGKPVPPSSCSHRWRGPRSSWRRRPTTRPTSRRCASAANGAVQTQSSPVIGKAGLFLKANSSLVGPSEGVEIRFPERRNEHEVELASFSGNKAATSRATRRSITSPAIASVST